MRDAKWGERGYIIRGEHPIDQSAAAVVRRLVSNEPDSVLLVQILGIEEENEYTGD